MVIGNFDSILPRIVPLPVPGPIGEVLARVLGIHDIESIYAALQTMPVGRALPERLLQHLEVTHRVSATDIQHIPSKGPVLLVVNHPFGILEGAVLATILSRVRPDVKFLANGILTAIPEIRELLIPVDPLGSKEVVQRNHSGLKMSIEFLQRGGLLVVFPAGEVSHFQWKKRGITDPPWNPAVARMLVVAARRAPGVSVVPVYVAGANSFWFHALGALHSGLRTALLARELLNKRRRLVEVRIGSGIEAGKLLAIPTDEERTRYLRWRTYLLAQRNEYKPNTSLPLLNRAPRLQPQQVVAPAIAPEELAADVARLPADRLLAGSADLQVYLTMAEEIPAVLTEIGRLREIAFRAAGEGTGKAADLDPFDAHYFHLFVWSRKKLEIVGAYRLAATDTVRRRFGLRGLYTATLFDYSGAFLDAMGPALELGRSFIRPEYQRAFAPLLLLWKGIGKFVARNPQYRVLFGPVSISNQYLSISRQLMVSYLQTHASLHNFAALIGGRNPLRRQTKVQPEFPSSGFEIDDLSTVVSDLEPTRAGVPVLLRQYLKLGGKLLGFNVDPKFANALDGLIVVDLTKTEPRLLERYLGKEEAVEFLRLQKGSYGT